jgi:hypothetical protein
LIFRIFKDTPEDGVTDTMGPVVAAVLLLRPAAPFSMVQKDAVGPIVAAALFSTVREAAVMFFSVKYFFATIS